MCKNEGFEVDLKVIDKWRGGTDMYRLVNLGAGPLRLQIFDGNEWREESVQYRWSTLTSRINELRNSQDKAESTETDTQQLKAEIAAVVTDIERDEKKGIFEKDYYLNRLRQLSAV